MSILVGSFRLHPELFVRTRLVNQCRNDCQNGNCCTEGVSATLYEVERIRAHADQVQPYLLQPYDFGKWDLCRAADISTPLLYENTPREQCWFLMRDRRCALHAYALDRNMPVPAIKPYFCRFFPLTLIDLDINVTEIAIDGKAYDTCLVQSEQEGWLFKQFEAELRRIIGDANYEELLARYPD
jgi:hypothetical protein